MSEPIDNKTLPEADEAISEAESTIFSAPTEHKDKSPAKKPLAKRAVAAILALLIVAGGAFAAIKLIPEKPAEEKGDATIPVLSLDNANIEKAVIINEKGSLTLLSETTESNGESTQSWFIDGVEKTFVSSDNIADTVKKAASLKALKEVEGTTSDFGLSAPQVSVTFYARNGAFEEVTLKLGDAAPANLGIYCSVSTSDKVYLIGNDLISLATLTDIDLATTVGISGVIQTSDNTSSFTDGSISKFDYMTLSGNNFPQALKIEMQPDETINAFFSFRITSPTLRIGNDDNITTLINFMSTGVESAGAYSLNANDATIKELGLDNPDVVFTISVSGTPYTVIAKKIDDNYCAVVDSYGGIIHKIPTSQLPFMSTKLTDYYSSFIVLENLSGLSNFKTAFADGTVYDFVTEYTEEGQVYKAFLNGTELDITNFKALYSDFIGLSPVEYDSKAISETALTVTLVHSDKNFSDTVITFKPYSSGRYQVEMNNIPMGLITTTTYDRFADAIIKVANGTSIK